MYYSNIVKERNVVFFLSFFFNKIKHNQMFVSLRIFLSSHSGSQFSERQMNKYSGTYYKNGKLSEFIFILRAP